MLGWLRRLFGVPPRDDGRFRYFDGRRWRAADPLDVKDALDAASEGKWADLVATWAQMGKPIRGCPPDMLAVHLANRAKVRKELTDLASKAFGVAPASESGGLTQAERLGLLLGFIEYLAVLKEDARPLAEPPPATA